MSMLSHHYPEVYGSCSVLARFSKLLVLLSHSSLVRLIINKGIKMANGSPQATYDMGYIGKKKGQTTSPVDQMRKVRRSKE